MTQNAILIVQTLFSNIWRLFNSWYFPGTRVTPAGLMFFILFAFLVIKFVSLLFFQNDSSDSGGSS